MKRTRYIPIFIAVGAIGVAAAEPWRLSSTPQFALTSTVAFVSTRHDPTANPFAAAEIYLLNGDGTNPRRLTFNDVADGFPQLSPDGKKVIFDTNRLRETTDPLNTSSVFVMDADGSNAAEVVYRGSSATWSPDGKFVAYHASASGTGVPIKPDPGAATTDSDIFVINVDDAVGHTAIARNLTNSADKIDDDADWSPGGQRIAFTSHDVTDNQNNSVTAEIYLVNSDGSGTPTRLTFNSEEERSPTWSPDGSRILYSCRRGEPIGGATIASFELCVINADGTGETRLTYNRLQELTPTWSPDGSTIMFHRNVAGLFQLFAINADGTQERQVTNSPGMNAFPHWGLLRVHVK